MKRFFIGKIFFKWKNIKIFFELFIEDVCKETNKVGVECSVSITKKGSKITLVTENLGIAIENVTTILNSSKDVYVALTGDEVALTDIRIR